MGNKEEKKESEVSFEFLCKKSLEQKNRKKERKKGERKRKGKRGEKRRGGEKAERFKEEGSRGIEEGGELPPVATHHRRRRCELPVAVADAVFCR